MTPSTFRPVLALTMGDPVGVGPEIIVKALVDARIYQVCRPLVLGDLSALDRARLALAPALKIHVADRPAAGRYQLGTLDLMPLSQLKPADLAYGRPTPASGKAMVGYILTAIDLALANRVEGLVTAPISKISMKLSGYDYPGHTELLAEKTKTPEFAMMLAGGDFRVVLATIHCALAEVPQTDHPGGPGAAFPPHRPGPGPGLRAGRRAPGGGGPQPPRQRRRHVRARRRGRHHPRGPRGPGRGPGRGRPLPGRHPVLAPYQGEFAAIVCMYHDQGLIPLKLLHFMDGVNVTLGLPIIRTSVDHGTAYNLAGKGSASPDSLKAAIVMAAEMAKRRFGGEK